MRIGDAISTVATPIAQALNLPCIDPETKQLRPESTCNQIREKANQGRYADAFYQFVFRKPRQQTNGNTPMEEEKLHYLIQIDVEAENAVEALAKKNDGKVISINPKPQPRPAMPTQPTMLGRPAPK